MKMKITVEIEDNTGCDSIQPVKVETEVPDFEEFKGADTFRDTFDQYEQSVLKARNQVAQTATEAYLTELSKKKPIRD